MGPDQQTNPLKKPWSTPQLTAYGRMMESTRTTSTGASDRNKKTGFEPVDVRAVLTALSALPIETWSYKWNDPAVRHIGPMAQDFAAAFGVGDDDTRIHVVDAAGVAFAAILGLHSLLQEQEASICILRRQLSELEAGMDDLRASVERSHLRPSGVRV